MAAPAAPAAAPAARTIRPDAGALAVELQAARLAQRTLSPLSERPGGLEERDAYAVQDAGIRLREDAGERLIGGKLGFTSAAMREAMGVASPNFGWLTDAMLVRVSNGWGCLDLRRLIHPKAEVELGFVLGEDLGGPDAPPVTAADVQAATRAWVPVIELVDSRFTDYRFASVDNIADNSSAARLVVGEPVSQSEVGEIDLRLMGCVLTVDGDVADTATGAAVDPDPASAVAWMVNACGRVLPAGSLIISGSMTRPVDVHPGAEIVAELEHIGCVALQIADADHPQQCDD